MVFDPYHVGPEGIAVVAVSARDRLSGYPWFTCVPLDLGDALIFSQQPGIRNDRIPAPAYRVTVPASGLGQFMCRLHRYCQHRTHDHKGETEQSCPADLV